MRSTSKMFKALLAGVVLVVLLAILVFANCAHMMDTTITVTSSTNPSLYAQSVSFTATVSAVSPGAGSPTGTVDFDDGTTPLITGVPLSENTATYTTTSLAIGMHSITAVYSGDGSFKGSTSAAITQTANPAPLTVTANGASKVYGAPLPTFSATAAGLVNGDTLASLGTLLFSTTAMQTSPVGTYPITPGGLT